MDNKKIAAKFIVGTIVTAMGFSLMKVGVSRIIYGAELVSEEVARRIREN